MTFLAPIAGLIAGAIGAGLVLLMYMLKLRRRPVLVSSTLLWKRAVKDLEGNIPWQRLTPTMLLLLHLLIVALLALAIARPVADLGLSAGQRVAIVIDTSASMNARNGDRTLLDTAKREAAERVRGLFDSGRSPRVSVIEAGFTPRAVLLDSAQRGRVLGAIDSLEPSDQPADVLRAIELLERLLPDQSDEESEQRSSLLVWLLSDGGSLSQDTIAMRGGVGELLAVGPTPGPTTGLANLGIAALSAQRDRVDTDLCRVFVRVVRSAPGPKAGVVRIHEGEELIVAASITFEDGSNSATHTSELRLSRGALLRAQLASEDALENDNSAWVRVPSPDPLAITVVAPNGVGDPLLIDPLEVIARAPVRVIAPDEPVGTPDLVVYDGVDAPTLPSVPSIGFGSASGSVGRRLDEPSSLRRVLGWERNDPLLRDSGIGAMSYVATVALAAPGEAERVLARDAQGPVMVERVDGGVRHLRLSFALHDSDWGVQFGFTVFLAQVCEQLLPGVGGSGEVYRTSEVITYLDDAGIERSLGPYPSIGVVALPNGREVGISLLDEDESTLQLRDSLRIGDGSAMRGGRAPGLDLRTDLWRWFIGAAIVLLLIEWVLYLRRVRIAS